MKELEIIHQAIFTEPDDQSSWLYHKWLVQSCCNLRTSSSSGMTILSEIIENEITAVKELLEVEEHSKCK